MDKDPQKKKENTGRQIVGPQDQISKFMFNARLLWRLFWDGRVRLVFKLIPIGVLVYLLSPIDLIPEGVLGWFGLIDDVVLVKEGTAWFFRLVKNTENAVYREQAIDLLRKG